MRLKNVFRNLFNIRKERAVPPAGPNPQIGSSIVRETLRIKLKYPISDEQWEWFTARGWRTVDMRTDRRNYTCLPDKILMKLLNSQGEERENLHHRLFRRSSSRNHGAPSGIERRLDPNANRRVSEKVVEEVS